MIAIRLVPVTNVLGVNGLGCLRAMTWAQPSRNNIAVKPNAQTMIFFMITFVLLLCVVRLNTGPVSLEVQWNTEFLST